MCPAWSARSATTVLHLPPAPQSVYATAVLPGEVRGGPLAVSLESQIRARLPGFHLKGDGRLADLAILVGLATEEHGRGPSLPELDRMAREVGFVGPLPLVFVMPRRGDVWEGLDTLAANVPSNATLTHYGVTVMDPASGQVGVLALGAEHVDLEPVPRTVATGRSLRLAPIVSSEYTHPELVWTKPDGTTQRLPLVATEPVTTPPLELGTHRFEILAEGPAGLEVLANFPVIVGDAARAAANAMTIDESDPRRALLDLLNRERAARGLRQVVEAPELDAVASAHSRDMTASHFFGHLSPTTGNPSDRVRAAGYRLALFGENVAKAPTISEAHAMLLTSPGHLANIVNGAFSHVGLGIERDPNPSAPSLLVTELFAAYPSPISDPGAAAEALLDATRERLAAANGPSPRRIPSMDNAARDIAVALSTDPKTDPEVAMGAVLKQHHLNGTSALVGFPLDVIETARDPRLVEWKPRRLGIAILQVPEGDRPMTNIVVILARR